MPTLPPLEVAFSARIEAQCLDPALSETPNQLPEDLQTARIPPKRSPPKHNKGKSSTRKETAVLEWSEEIVQNLMHQYYDKLSHWFGSVRNNASIGEAWVLLATEMSRRYEKPISTN
ncbi:hypothetical protein GN958_ATG13752 [Phytophthora infestans]|uniref:Uncharacterized protein n=1 Tax=Phytophthora infestans TaxID=4787 RepID=A0A8S9UFC3_PHYIN|nr:hypothetical protein GN958_ATG13752 [Phytophthora infestans]